MNVQGICESGMRCQIMFFRVGLFYRFCFFFKCQRYFLDIGIFKNIVINFFVVRDLGEGGFVNMVGGMILKKISSE